MIFAVACLTVIDLQEAEKAPALEGLSDGALKARTVGNVVGTEPERCRTVSVMLN